MMVFFLAEIPFPGWDPVAIHLGPINVRWYGLGYLGGFLIAGWILDRLGRQGFVALTKHLVSDLIAWLVFGVLIGGRMGYAIFYEPHLLTHPLELIEIWTGGLSFHGGLAGVVIASWLFARKHGIPWRRLADALSLCIPAGIVLVRCANFINGELYGRLAPASVPWAMRFPTDPMARVLSPELARGGSLHWHEAFVKLKADGTWARILPDIPLRHPSQLYEALFEGIVIGVILWAVYARYRVRTPGTQHPAPRPGLFAALFLALYAVARFFVEFTRQPDAQLGFVLGPFSMGQLLSVAVLIGAAALFFWPQRQPT